MSTARWDPSASPSPSPSTVPSPQTPPTSPSGPSTQDFSSGAAAPSLSQASPSKVVASFDPTAFGAPADVARGDGRYLAHFRVDKRLAAGGMGEVFLGYDTSLQRPVAIKTIRGELARDTGFLARFLREATAQANVVHPAVVQVYYVGVDRSSGTDTWFIAMQVVDGGSLYDVVKDGKTLTWQQASEQMTSLVEGLCVAEERGIVHRDIKPANILVDRQGKVLLADFGLAVAAGAKEAAMTSSAPTPAFADSTSGTPSSAHGSQLQLMSLTQVGVVMGTPEYVAPEQLRIGAVDVRADIYALAATFFHLLTGKPVADATTLPAVISLYERGHKAPPLRSLRNDVPRAFADVIDRCLAVDRAQRPASMKELLQLLRRSAPQPVVPASPLVRAVVWAVDVAPFVAVTAATYEAAPWLGPLLFFLAGFIGLVVVGASPGIWMMRLRLRTEADGDVSVGRGFARFVLQHGWYVPVAVGFSALYAASNLDVALVVGAVWFVVSVIGSAGVFVGARQTLHDKLTRTRVLVDVR